MDVRVLPATRAALDATGSPSTTAGRWLDERAQDEAQRAELERGMAEERVRATIGLPRARANFAHTAVAETQTPGQSESDQASGDSQSAKTRVGVTRRRGS